MSNPNLKENKLKRFIGVSTRKLIKFVSPLTYIKLQYRYITHHKLNLKNPTRYTEKLQYLRYYVYPKWDEVSRCAGRVMVRDYIKEKGYGDSLIPCLGVFDKFEDIDFSKLPKSFVLKASHASGFNIIVKNKDDLNIELAKKKFDKWLKKDYGKMTLERHYSKIKPQIIIEEYIGDKNSLPTEYKIHVYNGKARNLYVVTGRGSDIRYTELYIDYTPFDGSQFNGWKKADKCPEKPSNFSSMVKMAEDCCKQFPFVRFDCYNIDGKIYFSEMTFTPAKGTLILDDDKADFQMGKWLDISKYMKTNSK
ncbi:MAG TPA: hypothetical protein DD377_01790 [Firmicutes bacterium]|nr:hypothetical protein [Bacillota bacterium]